MLKKCPDVKTPVVLQRIREKSFDGEIAIVRGMQRKLRGKTKNQQPFIHFESRLGIGIKSSLDGCVLVGYRFNMLRPLQIEYPGAWYHVMNRGRRGEDVFSDKKDFETFLVVLQGDALMFDARVAAYCLMSNYYHILMQTPAGNLSREKQHDEVPESKILSPSIAEI